MAAGQGALALDDPVRRHVAELRLGDETVAERVTIRHLLNHTAGWAGDLFVDTGDGDDCTSQIFGAGATVRVVAGGDDLDAEVRTFLTDAIDLGLGVAGKSVDSDDRGQTETADVFDVLLEVFDPSFNGAYIGLGDILKG